MNYRSTQQIYADVLSIAKNTDRDGIAITTLCRKSNLSHGRLKDFISNLTGACLINVKFQKNYVITEKGRTYLENYIKFHDLAESFGLEI